MIGTLIYLLFVPLGVMLLARRWKWIDRVSPMTVLYIVGLAVANLLPASWKPDSDTIGWVQTLAIPLAIPLMLMCCNLRGWQVGKALKIFLSGLASVLLVTVAGFFLFRSFFDGGSDHFAQVCAVATGIYTGGIPNMGAISQAVGMDNETYLYITSYDLMVTGAYLIFVIFAGKNVFRRLLPDKAKPTESAEWEQTSDEPLSRKNQHINNLLSVVLAVVIAAISYGVSLLLMPGKELNMTLFILLLTSLSIAASFLPFARRQQQNSQLGGSDDDKKVDSFEIGLYCVYVFCLAIATSCDVRTMDIGGSLPILYYLTFIVFGSVMLQILFARMMKVDGDSVLVCSVALINSPPFVPLVAALLGNRQVIITGITIGLLGYMMGNYLGIGLFHLLATLG